MRKLLALAVVTVAVGAFTAPAFAMGGCNSSLKTAQTSSPTGPQTAEKPQTPAPAETTR
jgi:hypothetical protein